MKERKIKEFLKHFKSENFNLLIILIVIALIFNILISDSNLTEQTKNVFWRFSIAFSMLIYLNYLILKSKIGDKIIFIIMPVLMFILLLIIKPTYENLETKILYLVNNERFFEIIFIFITIIVIMMFLYILVFNYLLKLIIVNTEININKNIKRLIFGVFYFFIGTLMIFSLSIRFFDYFKNTEIYIWIQTIFVSYLIFIIFGIGIFNILESYKDLI